MSEKIFSYQFDQKETRNKHGLYEDDAGLRSIKCMITNFWVLNSGRVLIRIVGPGIGKIKVFTFEVYLNLNAENIKALSDDLKIENNIEFIKYKNIKDENNEAFLETLTILYGCENPEWKFPLNKFLKPEKNEFRASPFVNFTMMDFKDININQLTNEKTELTLVPDFNPNCNFLFTVDLPNGVVIISETDTKYGKDIIQAFCLTMPLISKEKALCKKLKIDVDIAMQLKKISNNALYQSVTYDYGGEILSGSKYIGISSKLNASAYSLLYYQKASFLKKGYVLFMDSNREDELILTVIKGTSDLEIIEYRQTHGINHEISSLDIKNKLSQWEASYGIEIFEISSDSISLNFKETISNPIKIAEEAYSFCPDIVDQGAGTIKKLAAQIKIDNGIYLWWD